MDAVFLELPRCSLVCNRQRSSDKRSCRAGCLAELGEAPSREAHTLHCSCPGLMPSSGSRLLLPADGNPVILISLLLLGVNTVALVIFGCPFACSCLGHLIFILFLLLSLCLTVRPCPPSPSHSPWQGRLFHSPPPPQPPPPPLSRWWGSRSRCPPPCLPVI
nr:protein cornichon homolog 3 isoform X1 [Oryctolagus cuniculus]XP_051676559.1 protein cornichon homolog 3 isoform X1 [Oryctolagus cuniculus]